AVILAAIASDLNQAVGRGEASWSSQLLRPLVIIVVSANLFSLVTWSVFNVASNLGWDVANLLATSAIFIFASYLQADSCRKLLTVMFFGILASISFPHGFLVWPVLATMVVVAFVTRWTEHKRPAIPEVTKTVALLSLFAGLTVVCGFLIIPAIP